MLLTTTFSTGALAGMLIGVIIAAIVIGLILGFVITRYMVKKQLKDNPPITEKQIRAMYMSMGRKPSEADIKKTMNAIKRAK
ncbi:YneF family protein [Mycoplasma mycoides]|uniref:YneF family protein n=1 Tax=Mycoplasma mycoides TaxID=2102 RepID=UPI0027361E88|nr:YneF family protein [Mycoplasma mycoides]MDP4040201.1 YneF family protein [Mycoplasma mycoides]MDP4041068.1 YneF family protein [Mycoplasma mycoides]MDP4041987.1 YneF family protein [Mycoplasma mycoides]MDP4043829.1 YneF family protein [Mycoplasma mycoides]MDP4044736.1 YneF family protein [Mycoplasma mycoides]